MKQILLFQQFPDSWFVIEVVAILQTQDMKSRPSRLRLNSDSSGPDDSTLDKEPAAAEDPEQGFGTVFHIFQNVDFQ